jgi:hypothetical protein
MAAGDPDAPAEPGGDADTRALEARLGLGPRSKLGQELTEGRTPPTLVATAIAWAVTLAPVGFGRGAPSLAAVLAVGALAAGLGGPVLARTRPRAGRHVGISLFVALATATWLAGSQAIQPARLDTVRGVLGAVAWGVFALSWSDRWGSRRVDVPHDPEAPLLLARSELPVLATALASLGVVFGLVYLVLAWQVRDPDRSLVAQAIALLCAVGIVTGASVVATARGKARSAGGRRLTPPVVRALLVLVAVAVTGAVYMTAMR